MQSLIDSSLVGRGPFHIECHANVPIDMLVCWRDAWLHLPSAVDVKERYAPINACNDRASPSRKDSTIFTCLVPEQ